MERVTNPSLVVVVCFSSCTTHKRLVGTNERDAMDAISEFLSLTALMKGIKDSVARQPSSSQMYFVEDLYTGSSLLSM